MKTIFKKSGKGILSILISSLIILPFGNVFAQGTNYRYTGQENDPSSNLYYYGQRYYDPNVGRFTQPDPVSKYLNDPQKLNKATGQDLQKFLEKPQALNEYSYTQNNPVKYTDPSGEFLLPALAITGVVFSGVFLNGINTAQAPTVNSTPSGVQSRDFGDIVSGWNKVPKAGRFMIGLITGGLTGKATGNIAARLATKLDSELAGSLAKRAEGGFINLYRGVDAGEFERIMEKGFQPAKFITTYIAEAMSYMANKGVDPKLVTIRMPLEKFTQMIENEGLKKGSFGEEFNIISDAARKIINQYIIK